MKALKCVLLGEPLSGKTSLINTFMKGYFEYNTNKKDTSIRYDVNFVYKIENLYRNIVVRPFNFYFKLYDYELFESNQSQNLMNNELDEIGNKKKYLFILY
jgi:GTPase SAR1 family protein